MQRPESSDASDHQISDVETRDPGGRLSAIGWWCSALHNHHDENEYLSSIITTAPDDACGCETSGEETTGEETKR